MFTQQDLEYFSGSTIILPVTFLSNASAIDITGWTVRIVVKTNPDIEDSNATIDMIANMDSASSGIALFTIPHVTTKLLLGSYWYDIRYMIGTTRQVDTVLQGKLVFKRAINLTIGDNSPSASPSVSSSPSASSSPSSSPSASTSPSASPSISESPSATPSSSPSASTSPSTSASPSVSESPSASPSVSSSPS